MSTLEIYFWILLPVYLVGALTIANWLSSHVNRLVYAYKLHRTYKSKIKKSKIKK